MGVRIPPPDIHPAWAGSNAPQATVLGCAPSSSSLRSRSYRSLRREPLEESEWCSQAGLEVNVARHQDTEVLQIDLYLPTYLEDECCIMGYVSKVLYKVFAKYLETSFKALYKVLYK